MRIYVKESEQLHRSPYGFHGDLGKQNCIKARLLFREGVFAEGLKLLLPGTQLIIDGLVVNQDEDDYGFSGTAIYYKVPSEHMLYTGVANKHIVEKIRNAKKTIYLQYVGSDYVRSPMFT